MAKMIKKSTVKKSVVPKAQRGKKVTTAGQAYMKYVPGATAKDTLGTDDTRFRGPGFAENTKNWDVKNKMLDMTYGENNPAYTEERAKQSPAAVKAYIKELKKSKLKTGGAVKKKMKNGGAMLKQAPKSTMEKISSTKLKDVPEKAVNVAKKFIKSGKDKVRNTINKVKNTTVGDVGRGLYKMSLPGMIENASKPVKKTKQPDKVLSAMAKRNGGKVGKMRNGGSLSGLNASKKRMGPVDPKGAFTKVQKKTLKGAKGKASLTKDKQLGATKMAKKGMNISKKK
jgi:hypothetical protein